MLCDLWREVLLAFHQSRGICCGVEFDPLYVDVIIQRYEAATGIAVILADTGETSKEITAHRRTDEGDGRPSGLGLR